MKPGPKKDAQKTLTMLILKINFALQSRSSWMLFLDGVGKKKDIFLVPKDCKPTRVAGWESTARPRGKENLSSLKTSVCCITFIFPACHNFRSQTDKRTGQRLLPAFCRHQVGTVTWSGLPRCDQRHGLCIQVSWTLVHYFSMSHVTAVPLVTLGCQEGKTLLYPQKSTLQLYYLNACPQLRTTYKEWIKITFMVIKDNKFHFWMILAF